MEQQFQPKLKPEFVQNAITLYQKNPRAITDDLLDQIQLHAEHYGIPFQRDWKDEDFRLLETIKQAGTGFIEGFTTLKVGNEPETTAERIARSAGHLAGFVGYVPAIGPKVLKGASAVLRGNSIPMLAAKAITNPAKRISKRVLDSSLKGRSGAAKTAYDFLNKDVVKGTVEGAFHLGAASAVSSWQGGIDEMVQGFFGGTIAGGGFRLIGNYVQFAKPPTGKQIGPNGQPIWKKLDEAQKADVMLRSTAGAMFTGLPSTMRGDTTPEQVYEYLLGGYFGFREAPAVTHFVNKFMGKIQKKAQVEKLPLPEEIEGWKDLSPEVQASVKNRIDNVLGEDYQLQALVNKFGNQINKRMKDLKINPKEAWDIGMDRISLVDGKDGKIVEKDIQAVAGDSPTKKSFDVEEGKEINKEIVKGERYEISEADVVEENPWEAFVRSGKVEDSTLDYIAERLSRNEPLTPEMEAIRNENSGEINGKLEVLKTGKLGFEEEYIRKPMGSKILGVYPEKVDLLYEPKNGFGKAVIKGKDIKLTKEELDELKKIDGLKSHFKGENLKIMQVYKGNDLREAILKRLEEEGAQPFGREIGVPDKDNVFIFDHNKIKLTRDDGASVGVFPAIEVWGWGGKKKTSDAMTKRMLEEIPQGIESFKELLKEPNVSKKDSDYYKKEISSLEKELSKWKSKEGILEVDVTKPDSFALIDRIGQAGTLDGVSIRFGYTNKKARRQGAFTKIIDAIRKEYPDHPIRGMMVDNPNILKMWSKYEGSYIDVEGKKIPIPKVDKDFNFQEWQDKYGGNDIVIPQRPVSKQERDHILKYGEPTSDTKFVEEDPIEHILIKKSDTEEYLDVPNRVQYPPAKSRKEAHAIVDGKKVSLTEEQKDRLVSIRNRKGSLDKWEKGFAEPDLYELGLELIKQAEKPKIVIETIKRYDPDILRDNPDKVYLFGDNNLRKGKKDQSIIRDEPNAIGILTKDTPSKFLSDIDLQKNISIINKDFQKVYDAIKKGKIIVFPEDGLGTGNANLKKEAPKTWEYLQSKINDLKPKEPLKSRKELKLKTVKGDKGKNSEDPIKGMYEKSEGFVGEIPFEYFPDHKNYSYKKSEEGKDSGSKGWAHFLDKDNKGLGGADGRLMWSGEGLGESGKTIMVSRSRLLKEEPLLKTTEDYLLELHNKGNKFIVEDRLQNKEFINHLEKIGADYTIYHAGEKPKVIPTMPDLKEQKISAKPKEVKDEDVIYELEDMEVADMAEADVEFLNAAPIEYTSWVNKHAKALITDIDGVVETDKLNRLSEQLFDKFSDFTKKYDPKTSNMDDLYKEISSLKIPMNDESKAYWRSKVRQEHYHKFRKIAVINMDGGKISLKFMHPKEMNLAGNQMKIAEAPSVIEDIFYNRMKEKTGKDYAGSRPFTDFTHIVFRSPKQNFFKEYSLSDMQMANLKAYQDAIIGAVKKFDKKGYHYFSGRAASEQMKFIKYHPDTPDKITKKNQYTRIYFDRLAKSGLSAGEKIHNYSRDKWIGRFGKESGKLFDKAFVSNILYDLEMNGFKPDLKNLEVMFKKENDFINHVVNFNKRMQIFSTGASPGERRYVDHILKGEDYNVALVEALSDRKSVKKLAEKMNMHRKQITDGAVFTRQDIFGRQLLDMGAPVSMDGELKTFIVDYKQSDKEGPLGAFLSKHMQHRASDKLNKEMMDKNIHHIVYSGSASKQNGRRKPVYAWWDKGLKFGKHSTGTEIKGIEGRHSEHFDVAGNFKGHKLSPESFRYVMAVTSTDHSIEPTRMVKQMWTPLALFSKEEVNFKAFEDMFNSTVEQEYLGNEEVNEIARKAMNDPENIALQNRVLDNIEDVGFKPLLNLLHKPGLEKFAQRAYQRITSLKNRNIADMYEAGELTESEVAAMRADTKEFNTIAEKLINLYKGELSIQLDKDVSPYIKKTLENFMINRLTQPRWQNGITGVMKPYAFEMIEKFPKLNKREDLYLLDSNHEKKVFNMKRYNELADPEDRLALKNKITFKEMVDILESKTETKEVKRRVNKFLESVGLRVPMDSASGAQVLKFGGFTGNKGWGIYLNGNTMEALGGADLDGDKSHMFFGFKDKWKKLYSDQTNEFYDENGNYIPTRNKKDDKLWVKQPGKDELALAKSMGLERIEDHPILKYSPYHRLISSEGAFMGRQQMGGSVVRGQVLTATYNALGSMPNGRWIDEVNGNYVQIKNSSGEKREIRNRLRDSISYAADATNYSALKNYEEFSANIFDAMFEVGHVITNKNGTKTFKPIKVEAIEKYKNYFGKDSVFDMHKIYKDANSALYGKNYGKNRSWTYGEKLSNLRKLKDLPESIHNKNILYRVGEMASNLKIDDSILKRINYGVVRKRYADYNARVDRLAGLGKLLGRSSFTTKYNNPLEAVIRKELWDPVKRETLGRDEIDFTNFIKKFQLKEYGRTPVWGRDSVSYLERLYNKVDHFLGNDIKLQVSAKQIYDHINKHKLETDRAKFLWHQIQDFKLKSWLRAKENSKDFEYTITIKDKSIPISSDIYEKLTDKQKETMKADVSQKEKISAKYTQEEIDNKIRTLKEVTPVEEEKALIDMFILSPMQKGPRYELLEELLSSEIKNNDLISEILQESAKTGTSRIGLYSKEIDRKILTDFYTEYKDVMNKMLKEDTIMRGLEVEKEVEKIVEEGAKVEGQEKKLLFFEENSWLNQVKDAEAFKSLDPEIQKVYDRISVEMRKRPYKVGVYINGMVRDMFGKDITEMNLQDWKALGRWFDDINNGTWLGKFMDIPEDKLGKIPKIYHWMFPETIGRKMMKVDFQLLKKKGFFTKDGKPSEGTTYEPTSTYGKIHGYAIQNYHLSQKRQDEEEANIRGDFDYIYSFKDGLKLFELATYLREKSLIDRMGSFSYKIPKSVWKQIEKYSKKEYTYLRKGKKEEKETRSGSDIIKQINKDLTKWFDTAFVQHISEDPGARSKYRKTGVSITDAKIRESLIKEIKAYEEGDKKAKKQIWGALKNSAYIKDPIYDHDMIFKQTAKELYEGKVPKILTELGIDGLNVLANDIKVAQAENIIIKAKLRSILPFPTGRIGEKEGNSDTYFPHRDHPKAEIKIALERRMKKIAEDTTLTEAEKSQEIARLIMQMKNASINIDYAEGVDWMDYDDLVRDQLLSKKAEKEFVPDNIIQGTRNMLGRTAHIKGYNRTPEALVSYYKELIDTQHKQLTQIIGRSLIEGFKRKQYKQVFNKKGKIVDPELYRATIAWTNFFKMYLNEATGMPSIIPKNVYEDPYFNVKGTPYAWFADNRVKDKINKMSKLLGLKKTEMDKILKNVEERDLHRWSNLEGKYELATLLAHPKAAIANIFGGSALSVMSAGYNNFKKVRDYDWIRRNISEKLDSKEKQDAFARKHGIIEEMLLNEANLAKFTNKEFKKEAWDSIIEEVSNKIRKGENPDNRTVMEILKQHGVDKNLISKAAYFMTVSERMLRKDAFMTHYIEAYRRFKDILGPEDIDHPYLINMAKKGVKATQFMYAAPYRPAFARTALGKVYSRFQLWAWNSVGFRNRVNREAKMYGYTPGTKEFDRFKRTMVADLFVLGLANVFTYSIFESALPAPWNWFQDTADWIFGDEHERDRAFFGQYPTMIAPLQAISPPIMRLPASMFTAMVDDDWSRVSKYYIWTMFPFGRMARDVKGIFENPMMMLEKTTGFPLIKLNKQIKGYQDIEMLSPRFLPLSPPQDELGEKRKVISPISTSEAA